METQGRYVEVRREFAWYLNPDTDYVPESLQPLAKEVFEKLASLADQADRDFEVNDTFEGWTYIINDGKKNLASVWTTGRDFGEEIEILEFNQDGLFEGEEIRVDDPYRFNFYLILEKEEDGSISFGVRYIETDEHYEVSNEGTYNFELEVENDLIASGIFDLETEISIKEDYDSIERYEGSVNFVPSQALLIRMNEFLSRSDLNISAWGLRETSK